MTLTSLLPMPDPEPDPRPQAAEGVLEVAGDPPPNLRIWATYPATDGGPESVEVTVHEDEPVTAEFVTTVIAALRRPADWRVVQSVVLSPNVTTFTAGPTGKNFHPKGQQ